MRNIAIAILTLTLATSYAHARRGGNNTGGSSAVNLQVAMQAPQNMYVYQAGAVTVQVENIGTKNANQVIATIELPLSANSPEAYALAEVDNLDSRCVRNVNMIACQLGTIRKGKNTQINFDLMLPQAERQLAIIASVAAAEVDSDMQDNQQTITPNLLNYDVVISQNVQTPIANTHCTGGTDLSSFYECILAGPSSMQQHNVLFNPNGTISFQQQGMTGNWQQNSPDHLSFQYYDNGQLVAEFEGYGVIANQCFQGITRFPTNNQYVSAYQVCK